MRVNTNELKTFDSNEKVLIDIGDKKDIEIYSEGEHIYAKINYKVLDYANASHQTTVYLGGVQ